MGARHVLGVPYPKRGCGMPDETYRDAVCNEGISAMFGLKEGVQESVQAKGKAERRAALPDAVRSV